MGKNVGFGPDLLGAGQALDLVRSALDDDQLGERQELWLFSKETEAHVQMAEGQANPELTLFIEFVRKAGVEISVEAGHWHVIGDAGSVPAGLVALAKEFLDHSGNEKEGSTGEHPKFI